MKILDDIKQQVESEMKKFDPKLAQRKYLKITQSIKELFLKAVVEEKQSIKTAAQLTGINYSSAKAIWAEFKLKSQNIRKKKPAAQPKQDSGDASKLMGNMRRCSFKILKGCHRIKNFFMEIKSSVAQKVSGTHLIAVDHPPPPPHHLPLQ